jgi:sigma-B regulation protein RsbU (phosphoserine phosphatase)
MRLRQCASCVRERSLTARHPHRTYAGGRPSCARSRGRATVVVADALLVVRVSIGAVVDEKQLTSVLVEFARTLTADFSIQAILDHLVDRVVQVIPVSGAAVLLMESDGEHHFVAASDDVILGIETLQMQLKEGPCLQAYRTGEHVAIRDLAHDSTFAQFSPAAAQAGLGSVYAFPLRLDDHQLGALELYGKDPTDLADVDLAAAQVLADVTAAYLFNARARETGLNQVREAAELAATLQESLLPPELPGVPGLTVAARFQPGRGGTLVGGDFYDIFPLPHRRWGVVMGDVVGHGARAATLAALARYTLRTLAVLHASPRRVLAGLNATMLTRERTEEFLSVVYFTARATPHGVEVTLARGGHPAAILRRADGSVTVVEAPGSLIGVQPDPGFKDVRLLLEPGDSLLVYTDGVTEARRGFDQFGDGRLRKLVASYGDEPRTIVNAAIDAVLNHSGLDLIDDAAVLAVLATG